MKTCFSKLFLINTFLPFNAAKNLKMVYFSNGLNRLRASFDPYKFMYNLLIHLFSIILKALIQNQVVRGVPVVAQWKWIPLVSLRMHPWPRSVGRGSGIAMSCGVGYRCTSDLMWLWLWLAAIAPIHPLAWELSYAMGVALKSKKQNKTKQKAPTKPKTKTHHFSSAFK